MDCTDTVLPEPLLKNHNVYCFTFERNTLQLYNDNLCLFSALSVHLHGNKKLEQETSKNINLFLNNSGERDVSKLQGVHLNDIPKDEDLMQLNIFLYDIDFVDGKLIGELCRRSIQKSENSVKLLRYNNHICYVNNINAFFKAFRCTTCDTILSKTGNPKRHLFTILIHALPILIPRISSQLPVLILSSLSQYIDSAFGSRFHYLIHWTDTTSSRQPIRIEHYVTQVVSQELSAANQNRVLRHPSRVSRHPRLLGAWRSLLGSRLESARYSSS